MQTPDRSRSSQSGAGKFRVLDGNTDRVPPHDVEAEEYVLSSCLLDDGVTLTRCLRERLTAGSFYVAAHRLIFEKMVELQKRRMPVELSVLAQELRGTQQLDGVGGFQFLTQISSRIGTTANAEYFIVKVRDLWVMREAIRHAATAVEGLHGSQDQESIRALIAGASAKFAKMAEYLAGSQSGTLRDRAAAATARGQAAIAGKIDRTRELVTGMPHLDGKILPFDVNNEDWYVVIAAPPSAGKSSLAAQIADANLERGKRGVVFLLETGDTGWLLRLAARHAKIDVRNLAREIPERITVFKQRQKLIEDWADERLWFFDDVFSIDQIELRVREINRRLREKDIASGVPPDQAHGLDFAIVDYLQLIAPTNLRAPREQQVAEISRRLKKLFKSENITGFVLAQLNRKSRDEKRRPLQSDLRESGAIEQDADRIAALHVPEEGRDGLVQDENTGTLLMEVLQLKSRNGPQGIVDVLFHRRHTRFEDAPFKGQARPGAPKPSGGYGREGSR